MSDFNSGDRVVITSQAFYRGGTVESLHRADRFPIGTVGVIGRGPDRDGDYMLDFEWDSDWVNPGCLALAPAPTGAFEFRAGERFVLEDTIAFDDAEAGDIVTVHQGPLNEEGRVAVFRTARRVFTVDPNRLRTPFIPADLEPPVIDVSAVRIQVVGGQYIHLVQGGDVVALERGEVEAVAEGLLRISKWLQA